MITTFTSESVCSGHPDKICDQISDAIVDAALEQDTNSRVAVETLATKDFINLAGEVTTQGRMNYKKIVRDMIKKLGYTSEKYHFSFRSPIAAKIHTQSPEIAVGVDALGAGDQGMMFGYACRETPSLMPLPITLAHALTRKIDESRETKVLPYLRPDGKAQVTVRYNGLKPVGIEHVVIAVPHSEEVHVEEVKKDIYRLIILPILETYGFTTAIKNVIVNGTGVWHLGGPASDTGVTGRKIIVDTYGGAARVGGGAFSGKDPTKVDRSGAYAARYIAKNIVASHLADRCEVRLAYFIGAKRPVMQEVETFGTAKKSEKIINNFMEKLLDTSVGGILRELHLKRPIYQKTAVYGHFGREGFPWEEIKYA